MLRCNEVTRLVSDLQDRPASPREQIALRFHLIMCEGCRNFERQMAILRESVRHLDAKMEGQSSDIS